MTKSQDACRACCHFFLPAFQCTSPGRHLSSADVWVLIIIIWLFIFYFLNTRHLNLFLVQVRFLCSDHTEAFIWSNRFGEHHVSRPPPASRQSRVVLEVCAPCIHVCRRVCVRVCWSSVRDTERILRSTARYADTKKAHLCNTHSHSAVHTCIHD